MQVRVLGSVDVVAADGTSLVPRGRRQRLLLAALAMHAPRPLSAERLIDTLWGDHLPANPHASLRTQISRLRTFLTESGLAGGVRHPAGTGYVLELGGAETDASQFEALHARATGATDAGTALNLLECALALWRGEPYGEFWEVASMVGEAARLREIWLAVQERRVACLLTLARIPEAVVGATALVAADPLREASRALLMRALYAAGRQHEALGTFQEYRRLLSAELGLSPSPALRGVEAEIVRHAGAAVLPTSPDAVLAAPGPMMRQQVRFAASADGVQLAYAVVGSGPPLVKAANWLNHLEFDWDSPVWRRLFRELAGRRTLVRYDERACGLSDPDPPGMSLEDWVLDLECVVDAAGMERFPLLGISQGCAVCIEYAARHPERVTALVLHGGYAAGWRMDPAYGPAEVARRDASIEIVRHGWGEDTPAYRQMFTQTFIPGGTAEEVAWFNELQRRTTSPANAARFMEAFAVIDVRHRLAQVRAPTLVLHSRGDQRIHYDRGRELAMGIPGARLVLIDSENHLILEHEPAFEMWVGELFRFLAEVEATNAS